MRAFVTGAAGFVGANLVRTLLDTGWDVHGLVRGAAPSLAGLDVTPVRGDMRDDVSSLAAAMRGSDAVFHVAAAYSLWRSDAKLVLASNVEGTRNILAAARLADVPRVVYTSSVAAIGVKHGEIADETHQSPLGELIGAYKQSKALAEREAVSAAEAGQDVVIVNPTTPIGPWDAKPTPTGEIIVRVLTGRMPAYVDTGLNLIDVRDVAAGHLAAFHRGRSGERYILGNENLGLRALLERLAPLTGRKAPSTRIPRVIPLVYASVGEYLLRPLGLPADVPLDGVRMAKESMFYSSAKAVRELGLEQRPVDTALADAVAWFRTHGYDH